MVISPSVTMPGNKSFEKSERRIQNRVLPEARVTVTDSISWLWCSENPTTKSGIQLQTTPSEGYFFVSLNLRLMLNLRIRKNNYQQKRSFTRAVGPAKTFSRLQVGYHLY